MSSTPGFRNIIQTRVELSEGQLTKREFGKSPVSFQVTLRDAMLETQSTCHLVQEKHQPSVQWAMLGQRL